MRFPLLFLATRNCSRWPWSRKAAPTSESAKESFEVDSDLDEDHTDNFQTAEPLRETLTQDEVKARGFLRNMKAYNPPEDLKDRLLHAVKESAGEDGEQWINLSLSDTMTKASILDKMAESTGYRVPNSRLNEMKTVADVLEFYSTPVSNLTSYVAFARSDDKPKNIYVIEEPKLFHPDDKDDPIHHGITAYPGLEYYFHDLRQRRLMRNFRAKTAWHHYEEKLWDYTNVPKNPPWCQETVAEADRFQPIFPTKPFGAFKRVKPCYYKIK